MGHLMAFTAFLREAGVPVDHYLRRQGLPVLCDDPDYFVPLLRVWSFLDSVARHEDSMFGWRAGAFAGDHNLNAGLLRSLNSAPTLFQALQYLVRTINSEASQIQVGIRERRRDILLYTHYPGKREIPGYEVSQAYQLEVFLDLIRHFLGRDWVPYEIGIEHPRAPGFVYEQLPGCRIQVQQAMGYIAVPRAGLHRAACHPVPKKGLADDLILNNKLDYVDTLRVLIKSYLADGYPSAQLAARLMGVSERTLARRLATFGLTYGALVDKVRFSAAKKLLQKHELKIQHIAMAVGFDDQSNFTRMFQRVGGLSPHEFRMASRH
jgi:AraC-like DNA-binding protein